MHDRHSDRLWIHELNVWIVSLYRLYFKFICFCNDWLTKKGKLERHLFFNYPENHWSQPFHYLKLCLIKTHSGKIPPTSIGLLPNSRTNPSTDNQLLNTTNHFQFPCSSVCKYDLAISQSQESSYSQGSDLHMDFPDRFWTMTLFTSSWLNLGNVFNLGFGWLRNNQENNPMVSYTPP